MENKTNNLKEDLSVLRDLLSNIMDGYANIVTTGREFITEICNKWNEDTKIDDEEDNSASHRAAVYEEIDKFYQYFLKSQAVLARQNTESMHKIERSLEDFKSVKDSLVPKMY